MNYKYKDYHNIKASQSMGNKSVTKVSATCVFRAASACHSSGSFSTYKHSNLTVFDGFPNSGTAHILEIHSC